MDTAASVIAVIQLTGSIVKICGGYIQQVKDAREEIVALQEAILGLERVLYKLESLLQGPCRTKLSTSHSLVGDISKCLTLLKALQEKIDPGRRQKAMRRLGFRALTWPFKHGEAERVISDLERYNTLTTDVAQATDRIAQNMDLDKLPIAHGAEFDSYMDQHEDYCFQGTRTELLRNIADWAVSSQGKCIFWLNGMAGTGKSTISRTVAKSLKEGKLLGASFFFKRGEGDRGSTVKLLPTITRQLVRRLPGLMPSVRKAIHNDAEIATKTLRNQFEKLLLQSLLSLKQSNYGMSPVVIVIDALDECEVDDDMRVLLRLLPRLKQSNALSLRIFLTSRPELPIRLGFSEIGNHDYQDLVLHKIPEAVTAEDISLFLKHRLSTIRKERSLPTDWPGSTNIQTLVKLSVPLFVFAATVCRLLEDPRWDPVDSLTEILTYRSEGSQLDGTYLPVLNRILNEKDQNRGKQKKRLIQEFKEVIGIIVVLENPLSILSLSRLTGIPERQIDLRLDLLHSVIYVPEDKMMPVQPFHLSFRDFLLDPEIREKTPLWVDEKEMHQMLATQCLYVCQSLGRNICGLPSEGTQRVDIDPQTIKHCLPPELQYACRFWAGHLVQSADLNSVIQGAFKFLQKHFLHWMEAMSILDLVSEMVGMINTLQSVIRGKRNLEVSEFLHDAKRFVLKFSKIVDEAPLQLYSSALVFAPKMAIIRRQFDIEIPPWISRLPWAEETWSAELQTLEGHTDPIWCVVFSPDGRILASSSEDTTVRLWNTMVGALLHTLEGHSDWVRSIIFSPNGRLLASGSNNETVKLWDTATGALQHTLEGHSDWFRSVAFSPNGRIIASSSNDKTVRLWDTATGALQHTLKGHSDWVRSIAFSPCGRIIASSSNDKTVRIWDTAAGSLQHTLKGHSDSIWCLAISPNGQLLASSSDDQTIRLWDTKLGSLQHTLKGHTAWIRSVAFSPDGRFLASGSGDMTVKLWNTTTGALEQILKGHLDQVWSVTFCPRGQLLASVSEDKTIYLWNTQTGVLEQTFMGHAGLIFSVAFSPDGQLLASGSYDMTIKLWDTNMKALSQMVTAHTGHVFSVAFSPDGQLLASGSSDKTIKLWNTTTGTLHQVLEGHLELVRFVAFSPNGQHLASSSDDETVRIWNMMREP